MTPTEAAVENIKQINISGADSVQERLLHVIACGVVSIALSLDRLATQRSEKEPTKC